MDLSILNISKKCGTKNAVFYLKYVLAPAISYEEALYIRNAQNNNLVCIYIQLSIA